MRVKVNKEDVVWSYLSIITTMMSNIVVVPFIVYYLSGEMLGLWYVFVSIGAIAHLFDFGFTTTFARNITYCWSGAKSLKKNGAMHTQSVQPDFYLMKNILETSKRIYLLISILILILMSTLGFWYISRITNHILGNNHLIAYGLYSIGVFLNMYYNYYDSFLRGVGAVKQASKNRTIAKFSQILLMIFLLICGCGIIGISIAYIAFGLIFRNLCKYHFYRYENIGDKLKAITKPISFKQSKLMFRTIWFNAWREGIVQLSMYCGEQVSVFICSMYLTLEETGVYSLGLQIAGAVSMMSSVLYTTYQPTIQSAYLQNDMEGIRKSMSIIVTSFVYLLIIGIIVTIFIGLPILRYIKPSAVISVPILLGIFMNQFIVRLRNSYSSYFSCTNRIIYMKSFIIGAVLCVVLSFVFLGVFHWGVWGVVIAQIVSQLIFNVWYWPIKAHKEMNLSRNEMFLTGTSFLIKKLKDIKVK